MNEKMFYPMMTATMKSLLALSDPMDMHDYIGLIVLYPNHTLTPTLRQDKIASLILKELERQYIRWKQGARK